MRFGINTWAWALPVDAGNLDEFLEWVAALELPGDHPIIEVFASPEQKDLAFAATIRDKAAAKGLGVVTCGFNPHMLGPDQPSPHLVSPDQGEREAAIQRACGFIDYAAEAAVEPDPGILSGPWHTRHMHFTGSGLAAEERNRLVEGLKRISGHAENKGVRAGFEVLNRFETYVLNTVDDALDVIREVGSAHLGINWDVSHAHIDEPETTEDSLARAVHSGHLFHVHLGENHRGEYGTGQIGPRTGNLLTVLREAKYKYGIVPELFCEALDGAVHKWIRREGDPTGAAQRSVQFLKQHL
jgi:D-psicose/D-tagatose/L-ribulose 3-epimerase